MSFQPLPPDSEDSQLTITIPKEMMPYLRDFFYPNKKKDGETLEKYVVRVLSDYGVQVFLREMSTATQQALIDNMNQQVKQLQEIATEVKKSVE